MQKNKSNKAGSIFICYDLLKKVVKDVTREYTDLYPEKTLDKFSISGLLNTLWNYLPSREGFDVHIISKEKGVHDLPTSNITVNSTDFEIKTHHADMPMFNMFETILDMDLENQFLVIIADDPGLDGLLSRQNITVDILIRKNNYATSMVNVSAMAWQDIDYMVAWSIGLETDEL